MTDRDLTDVSKRLLQQLLAEKLGAEAMTAVAVAILCAVAAGSDQSLASVRRSLKEDWTRYKAEYEANAAARGRSDG